MSLVGSCFYLFMSHQFVWQFCRVSPVGHSIDLHLFSDEFFYIGTGALTCSNRLLVRFDTGSKLNGHVNTVLSITSIICQRC